jgi:hypothetical protein
LSQVEEDDEPSLLVAMVEEIHDAIKPVPPWAAEPASKE